MEAAEGVRDEVMRAWRSSTPRTCSALTKSSIASWSAREPTLSALRRRPIMPPKGSPFSRETRITTTAHHVGPATAVEIRDIVGMLDDGVIAGIVALDATRDEVLDAQAWLGSDDYLHRDLHHPRQGKAARIFDLLDAEGPERDEAQPRQRFPSIFRRRRASDGRHGL